MVYVIPNAGPIAAQIAGRSVEMDVVAGRTLRAVRTVAAGHRLTGDYMNSLSVQTVKSRLPSRVGYVDDRLVVTTDPAALSIEYGHFVRFKNARRVRWVPGQHIMGRAIGMVR